MSFEISSILPGLNFSGVEPFDGPLAPKAFDPPEALSLGKPGPWVPPSPLLNDAVLEVPAVVVHGDRPPSLFAPFEGYKELDLRHGAPSLLNVPIANAMTKGLTPAPTWKDLALDEVNSVGGVGYGASKSIANGVLSAVKLAGSLGVQVTDDLVGGGLGSGKGPIQTFFPSFYRATESVVDEAVKTLLHPIDSGSKFLSGLQQQLQYAQTNAAHDPFGSGAALGEISGDVAFLGAGGVGATSLLARLLPRGAQGAVFAEGVADAGGAPRGRVTILDKEEGPFAEATANASAGGGRSILDMAKDAYGRWRSPFSLPSLEYHPPAFVGGSFRLDEAAGDLSGTGSVGSGANSSAPTLLLTSRFTHPAETRATYSGTYNYSYFAPGKTGPSGLVNPVDQSGGRLTVSKDPIPTDSLEPALVSGRFSVQNGEVGSILTDASLSNDDFFVEKYLKESLKRMGLKGGMDVASVAELAMRERIKGYKDSEISHPLLPPETKFVINRYGHNFTFTINPSTETSLPDAHAEVIIRPQNDRLILHSVAQENMPPWTAFRLATAALQISGINEFQRLEGNRIQNDQTLGSFLSRESASESPFGRYFSRALGTLGLDVISARWEQLNKDPTFIGPSLPDGSTKRNLILDFGPKASGS